MTRTGTRAVFLALTVVLHVGCGGSDGGGGPSQLSPQQPVGPPAGPILYALVSPDLDGSGGAEQLAGFGFDAGGSLVSIPGSPFATNGGGDANAGPSGIVATPDRRYLIVAHNASRKIESFSTGAQGELRSVSVATLAGDPFNLVIHPNGTIIYASLATSARVAAVAVDRTSGLLKEIPGSPFDVGTDLRDVAVDPSGHFLVTGHITGAFRGLRLHALDAQGAILGPIQSIPLPGRAGRSISYDRNGQFLFMQDVDLGIYVYRVEPGPGTLSLTAPPTSVGGFSASMVIHPQQNFAYVGRGLLPEVRAFAYDNAGRLTAAPGSPFAMPTDRYQSMAITRNGDRLYLAERLKNVVIGFNVNASSGGLTQIGPPVPVPGTTIEPVKRSPGRLFILN